MENLFFLILRAETESQDGPWGGGGGEGVLATWLPLPSSHRRVTVGYLINRIPTNCNCLLLSSHLFSISMVPQIIMYLMRIFAKS